MQRDTPREGGSREASRACTQTAPGAKTQMLLLMAASPIGLLKRKPCQHQWVSGTCTSRTIVCPHLHIPVFECSGGACVHIPLLTCQPLYVNLSINSAVFCQDEGEGQKNPKSEPTNSFFWMQI